MNYLRCLVYNIIMRHTKNEKYMAHMQEKKQSLETVLEEARMLDLLNEVFGSTNLKTVK